MTTSINNFTCVIDQSEHDSLEELHKHLRTLKVSQEEYYTKYAPRLDRGTGEPIPYRAPAAEYLKREFLNKNTLKKWFKNEPEAAQEWALQWLVTRRIEKTLTYAPCQVELRSCLCPDLGYFEKTFEGGYAAAAQYAGYELRFENTELTHSHLDCPVVIDTREQKPLTLPVRTIRGTLRSADYGLPPERDQLIYIERKSLNDFVGSLSDRRVRGDDSNLQRITRELERATEIGAYVVMLVEQKLSDCLAFNSIPYLKSQMARVRITPEHVFHNLRDLLHQFPHSFQVLFVDGRAEAAKAVVRILSSGESVKNVDLQWTYENGALNLS